MIDDLLKSIPRQPQRQDSTAAQLLDLRRIANQLGMYDAADVLAALHKLCEACGDEE